MLLELVVILEIGIDVFSVLYLIAFPHFLPKSPRRSHSPVLVRKEYRAIINHRLIIFIDCVCVHTNTLREKTVANQTANNERNICTSNRIKS